MQRVLVFLVLVMVTTLTLLWYLEDELSGVSLPSFGFTEENPIIIPDCELDLTEPTSSCTIKIGIINTYSRGSSCFSGGTEHKRGYELAYEKINNELGGIKYEFKNELGEVEQCQIELIQKNDQGNSVLAGQQVEELVDEGAVLIIGAYSSSATNVAAAEADRQEIPIIVPSASSELITALGYEWVFRINATSAEYVSQALAYTATLSEFPTVAVIYENTVFGESAAVAVTSQAESLGISVVGYESYQPGTSSFIAPLTSISRAKPEVIYLVSNNITDARNLLEDKEFLQIDSLFIANAGAFVSPDLLTSIDSEAEDVVVTAQWADSVSWRYENELGENELNATGFVELFQENYPNEMPGMRSVQTYTSLFIAKEVIENAYESECVDEETNLVNLRRCLRDGLDSYNRADTLFGPIDFDDTTGQNEHDVLLAKIIPDGRGGYCFTIIFPPEYRSQEETSQEETCIESESR